MTLPKEGLNIFRTIESVLYRTLNLEMVLYLLSTTNRASLSGPPQKSPALKIAEKRGI